MRSKWQWTLRQNRSARVSEAAETPDREVSFHHGRRFPRKELRPLFFLLLLMGGTAWGQNASPTAVSHRLEAMTSPQRDELRQKKDFFDDLPRAERERLRDLRKQIEDAPDREDLLAVMVRYSEWLKSLSWEKQDELKRLPTEQRIAAIKEILEQQEKQRFSELMRRKLPPEDYGVILEWFNTVMSSNFERLLNTVPPEDRARLNGVTDPFRRRMEVLRILRKLSGDQGRRPLEGMEITSKHMEQLTDRLSPEAQQLLKEASDDDQRRAIVRDWVSAATWSRFVPRVSDDDLRRFLEKEADPELRHYLENLPRDRMMSELRRIYSLSRYGGRPSDGGRRHFRPWRGDGPPRGGRGPGGGPPMRFEKSRREADNGAKASSEKP